MKFISRLQWTRLHRHRVWFDLGLQTTRSDEPMPRPLCVAWRGAKYNRYLCARFPSRSSNNTSLSRDKTNRVPMINHTRGQYCWRIAGQVQYHNRYNMSYHNNHNKLHVKRISSGKRSGKTEGEGRQKKSPLPESDFWSFFFYILDSERSEKHIGVRMILIYLFFWKHFVVLKKWCVFKHKL